MKREIDGQTMPKESLFLKIGFRIAQRFLKKQIFPYIKRRSRLLTLFMGQCHGLFPAKKIARLKKLVLSSVSLSGFPSFVSTIFVNSYNG